MKKKKKTTKKRKGCQKKALIKNSTVSNLTTGTSPGLENSNVAPS